MCHRVQSLLTSPKSPTATATCLHLLFDIISRGRVWVRGDYDSFIHSTIRTLHWWYKYWAFRQDCQLELEHIWPRATWQHFFSAWTPSAFTIGDRWPPSPPVYLGTYLAPIHDKSIQFYHLFFVIPYQKIWFGTKVTQNDNRIIQGHIVHFCPIWPPVTFSKKVKCDTQCI